MISLLKSKLGDRKWRICHLYDIIDKKSNRVQFRPNQIQQQILRSIYKKKMILKARQFGISTLSVIESLDFTLWNKNVTSCVIAHEQDGIKKIFRIALRAYEFLEEELKPKLDRGGGSRYEMFFPEINSRIYCDLESRGDTIHKLHVSEAAFIKDPDKLKATLQTVPLDGEVSLETTPNGMGNHFYDIWTDPNQSYAKFFFPWFIFPEYQIETHSFPLTHEEEELCAKVKTRYGLDLSHRQIAFRRLKQTELKHLFLQEYPEDDQTCFLSSGSPAMDLFIVKKRFDDLRNPLRKINAIQIYQEPDRNVLYACGADPAEGIGGDFSAASMFNIRTKEQVATLRGQFNPFEFAHRLLELCELYSIGGRTPPLLGVEQNNHGYAVLQELGKEHLNYPNLYYRQEDRSGWLTDKITRPMMLDVLIEGIMNGSLILNDSETLRECLTLINDNGKVQAASGKHDDCVMACAIAVQMMIKMTGLDFYNDMSQKILL